MSYNTTNWITKYNDAKVQNIIYDDFILANDSKHVVSKIWYKEECSNQPHTFYVQIDNLKIYEIPESENDSLLLEIKNTNFFESLDKKSIEQIKKNEIHKKYGLVKPTYISSITNPDDNDKIETLRLKIGKCNFFYKDKLPKKFNEVKNYNYLQKDCYVKVIIEIGMVMMNLKQNFIFTNLILKQIQIKPIIPKVIEITEYSFIDDENETTNNNINGINYNANSVNIDNVVLNTQTECANYNTDNDSVSNDNDNMCNNMINNVIQNSTNNSTNNPINTIFQLATNNNPTTLIDNLNDDISNYNDSSDDNSSDNNSSDNNPNNNNFVANPLQQNKQIQKTSIKLTNSNSSNLSNSSNSSNLIDSFISIQSDKNTNLTNSVNSINSANSANSTNLTTESDDIREFLNHISKVESEEPTQTIQTIQTIEKNKPTKPIKSTRTTKSTKIVKSNKSQVKTKN